MATILQQLFDQADGTTITAANSGPQGSTAFDSVTSNANIAFTYSSTQKHSGIASGKVNPNGSVSGNMAWSSKIVALSTSVLAYRGYFYFTGLPSVATNILFGYTSDQASLNFFNLTSTGTLTASTDQSDGTHLGFNLSGVTLAVNTLYRIEGYIVLSPTNGSLLLQVFNGDSTTALGTLNPTGIRTCTTAGATVTRVQLGKNTTSPTMAPYYVDAFAVKDEQATFGPYVPANPTVSVSASLSGATAALSATATTYDNVAPTYTWSQVSGPSATLSSTSAQSPNATLTSAGDYVFRVVVRDDLNRTATKDTTVSYAGTTSGPQVTGTLVQPRWVETITATPAAGGALSYSISPSANVNQVAPGVFVGLIPSVNTQYAVTVTETGNSNTTVYRFVVPAGVAGGAALRMLVATADSSAGGTFQ